MTTNRLLLLSALLCSLVAGYAGASGPKQVPQTGGSGTGPTTNPVSVAQGGTGNTTGNAVTATALAANPTDCSANQFATAIDASGNLTCAQPAVAQVTGAAPIASPSFTGTVTAPQLVLGGSVSKAGVGTGGVWLSVGPSTVTDTTGTGTVPLVSANTFGVPTFAASGPVIYTNMATLYVPAPVRGANVTGTLRSIYAETGIFTAGVLQSTLGLTTSGAASTINKNSNFTTEIGDGTTTASVTIGGGSNNVVVGSHLSTTGVAPGISACGGSPSVDANASDSAGTVTPGSGATSCTITFHAAYVTFNHCRATSQASLAAFAYSYTKSVLTLTATALTGAIDYQCDGQ